MLTFDHIAITAETLQEGVDWVETCLGVKLAGGGKHALMSTHNRLLALGDIYLEVIAADPEAPAPGHPRWFDMDRFHGRPRLTNWIARTDDIEAEVLAAPKGVGQPVALARGDYRWKMAIPDDGILPFDNAFPALIQWLNALHPTQTLPESGIRLKTLTIFHPQADALQAALSLQDHRVQIIHGPAKAMTATFSTPNGDRSLP